MKKYYFATVCAILGAGIANGQDPSSIGGREFPIARTTQVLEQGRTAPAPTNVLRADTIWNNTFSDPSDWVIAHEGPVNVDWQIGVGLENSGEYPTDPVESTTASDGYAMLDSDAGNNSSPNYEFAHMTTADPIDLSAYPNAILAFQTNYRSFTDERPLVQVSTDNSNWYTYADLPSGGTIDDLDLSAYPGLYDAFPGFSQGDVLPNPHHVFINISDVAGGSSTVWVRFLWVGIWGYSWFVDDVVILEQAMDDLVLDWALVANNDQGLEYGRMPSDQIGTQLRVGGQVKNFGVNDQTNIVMTMELQDAGGGVIGTAEETVASLDADSTVVIEALMDIPALGEGMYTVITSVVSDAEQGGEEFVNNTIERKFEVVNTLYGLDFIDVADPEDLLLSSYGTNSFDGAEDGFMVMTLYDLQVGTTVYGLDVVLANGTVEGGLISVLLYDTASIFADPPQLSVPIADSDVHTVTAADLANGTITIPFSAPTELAPDMYYAAVELSSNNNANDVRILDDTTVPQPAMAGAIYHSGDNTIYSNGNAFAVRLNLNSSISVPENERLTGISMFPNPTNGLLNIHMEEAGIYDVEVMNVLGERVHSTRIANNSVLDLNGNAAGVYMVRISNGKSSMTERITLK